MKESGRESVVDKSEYIRMVSIFIICFRLIWNMYKYIIFLTYTYILMFIDNICKWVYLSRIRCVSHSPSKIESIVHL